MATTMRSVAIPLRRFITIGASTALLFACVGIRASAREGLAVDARVSYSSAAQPELHVLVRNTSSDERILSVWAPRQVECSEKNPPIDRRREWIFLDLTNWHAELTVGRVRPGGWLHRSFPLGERWKSLENCRAEFVVSDWHSGEVIARDSISLDAGSPRRRLATVRAGMGKLDAVLEEDRDREGLLVLRVLVRNASSEGFVAYETARDVFCNGQPKVVNWTPRGGVLQGEDTGPVWVPPGGWGVFVNVLTGSKPLRECEANIGVSALDRSGQSEPIARMTVSLAPEGYLERPAEEKTLDEP